MHDLVISANPDNFPLSILVLKELLCQHYTVMSACHVHSSASNVSTKQRNILGSGDTSKSRDNCQLAITLIWKKGMLTIKITLCHLILSITYDKNTEFTRHIDMINIAPNS